MKVFKNYIYNSAYQLLLVLLPLVTAPYISRVLQPKGVGLNTVTYSIVQYFVLFATLGTATYGVREIALHQKDKRKRSQSFWGINFLSWITSLFSIVAFLIFVAIVREYKQLYLWQGIAILSTMFDVSWYFAGVEKFRITVLRNFIFKILTVVAIFTFVHKASDLTLYIAILTTGTLLSSLSLWPYLKKEIYSPQFQNLELLKHLKYTIALFIPTITVQIYVALNSQMIGTFDSIVHAGYFYQADKIIKILLSLISSVGVVMLPRISSLKSEGSFVEIRHLFIKSFNIITGLSVGIYFGILGVSLKFAPFFFGTDFRMVGPIMMLEAPIIVFTAWGIVFSNQYLIPLNKLRALTTSVILGSAFNILVNIFVIPKFGVIGATITLTSSEFLIASYKYFAVRHDFRIRQLFLGVWKYILAGMMMFGIVFMMNQYFIMNTIQLLIQVILGILIYIVMNILLKTELWDLVNHLFLRIKK